ARIRFRARRADHRPAVDVTLHDVPPETRVHRHRPFKVDGIAGNELTQIRAFERLVHDVGTEPAVVGFDRGHTTSVDCDRVAVTYLRCDLRAGKAYPGAIVVAGDRVDASLFFH